MLVIRKAQVEAMSAAQGAAFEGRVMAHLETAYPEKVWSWDEAELRAFVHGGIGEARGYGIELECDVVRYVSYKAEFGPSFPREAPHLRIREILERPALSGHEKMRLVFREIERFDEEGPESGEPENEGADDLAEGL